MSVDSRRWKSTFSLISATTSGGGGRLIVRSNVLPLASTASLVAGGFVWIPLPTSGSTYFQRRIPGELGTRAGKNDFLRKRRRPLSPEVLILAPDLFGIDDAHLALR